MNSGTCITNNLLLHFLRHTLNRISKDLIWVSTYDQLTQEGHIL